MNIKRMNLSVIKLWEITFYFINNLSLPLAVVNNDTLYISAFQNFTVSLFIIGLAVQVLMKTFTRSKSITFKSIYIMFTKNKYDHCHPICQRQRDQIILRFMVKVFQSIASPNLPIRCSLRKLSMKRLM